MDLTTLSCPYLLRQCQVRTFRDSRVLDAAAAAATKLLQSCPTLCDPIDSCPPGSAVPGILQARTLEWVAISFSNARKWKVKVKSLNRVQLLSDPMDCSLPGSSIHGIFQARVLTLTHLWGFLWMVSPWKTAPILPGFRKCAIICSHDTFYFFLY